MAGSILRRGVDRLRRNKKKQEKKAARQEYLTSLQNLPVDPKLVILEARNGRAIDGNVYYILKELLENPDYADLKLCVVTEDDEAEEKMRRKIRSLAGSGREKYVRLQSGEYYRAMATAHYIVNDATIGNFFIKRKGQIYLNVWHGTPLKTMGRKVSHEPHATGNVQKNFIVADYLLYPSEYMMDHMIEDYMIADLSPAAILMGGYPRNTVFFDDGQRQMIRKRLAPKGERIYAYMPTWRPALMGSELNRILGEIDQGLTAEEYMYVNVHPLAEETVDFSVFQRVRPFPQDTENYALLSGMDALLTDYSSVFYDFAVSGRKIVLLTYDEEDYFATRGLYEPISSLPFPQTKTIGESLEELRSPKDYDDSDFLETYCRYEGPEAARQLCARVFAGEDCMEVRRVPANGRPNILVYGGDLKPGPRTEETMRYLREADQARGNYFLTFNRKDLKDNYGILFDLPEGIRYIGRAGGMLLSAEQEEAKEKYKKGKLPLDAYRKIMEPAFALERKRFYGDMRIDRIVRIPEGEKPGPDASEEEMEFAAYADTGRSTL